jgi:hypothetical protein
VRDQGSTNGTLVNGESREGAAALRRRDPRRWATRASDSFSGDSQRQRSHERRVRCRIEELGMPLDADEERVVVALDRFDDPVRRSAHDLRSGPESSTAWWCVELTRMRSVPNARTEPAVLECHVVPRLRRIRRLLVLQCLCTCVRMSCTRRTADRDRHRLHPAAHAQQGNAPVPRAAGERELQGVAPRSMRPMCKVRAGTVVGGIEIVRSPP